MKILSLVATAAMLGACAPQPPGAEVVAAANPTAAVPPVAYVPVTAGTADYRPVEPKPWGDVNQRVAPEGSEE